MKNKYPTAFNGDKLNQVSYEETAAPAAMPRDGQSWFGRAKDALRLPRGRAFIIPVVVGALCLGACSGSSEGDTPQSSTSAESSDNATTERSPTTAASEQTTTTKAEVELDENGFETLETEKVGFLDIYEQAKEGTFFTVDESRTWAKPDYKLLDEIGTTDSDRLQIRFMSQLELYYPDLDFNNSTTIAIDMAKLVGSSSEDKLTVSFVGSAGEDLDPTTMAALMASVNNGVAEDGETTGDIHIAVVASGDNGDECIPLVTKGIVGECDMGGRTTEWTKAKPQNPGDEYPTALIDVKALQGEAAEASYLGHEFEHAVIPWTEENTDSGRSDEDETVVTERNHPGVHREYGYPDYEDETGVPGGNLGQAIFELVESGKVDPLFKKVDSLPKQTTTTQETHSIETDNGTISVTGEVTPQMIDDMKEAGAPEDYIAALEKFLADQNNG